MHVEGLGLGICEARLWPVVCPMKMAFRNKLMLRMYSTVNAFFLGFA